MSRHPAVERLLQTHPKVEPFLRYENPFQLIVAVVLSAQCTDAMVNQVTPALFARFPEPAALAQADLSELESLIFRTGFYRAKARNLKALAQRLVAVHQGQVPQGMDDLTALAGVGRKTAHVVRGALWGLPAIIVDTHFGRVVRRLGLSGQNDPIKLEADVAAAVAESDQYGFSMAANLHGRLLCHARKPRCSECYLADLCPSAGPG